MSEYWVLWPLSGMVMHLFKCIDEDIFSDGLLPVFIMLLLFFNAAIIGPLYLLIFLIVPNTRK